VSGQGGTKVIIIKKKNKHAGHHGGAWKVAYADFVTAMMALFIVLWLLTQSDQASKEKIAQYFRTGMLPGGTLTIGTPAGSNPPVAINIFPSGSVGGPSTGQPEKELAHDIELLLNGAKDDPELTAVSGHVRVRVTNDGTLIELVDGGDGFLFPVGNSGLKPAAIKLLERLAPLLAKIRNKVEIHGHTDGRPFDTGAKKSNWDLSFERANEARRVLETNGVPSGKIIAVQAHADSQLLNRKDPFAPENRRLSLLIVKDKTRARAKAAAAAAASDTAAPAPPTAPQLSTPPPTEEH
jgi:chemotaxis protein MotB